MTEIYLTAHVLTLVLEIIDFFYLLLKHLHSFLNLGYDVVLRDVDFCSLSETPSFTLFNDTAKLRKTTRIS